MVMLTRRRAAARAEVFPRRCPSPPAGDGPGGSPRFRLAAGGSGAPPLPGRRGAGRSDPPASRGTLSGVRPGPLVRLPGWQARWPSLLSAVIQRGPRCAARATSGTSAHRRRTRSACRNRRSRDRDRCGGCGRPTPPGRPVCPPPRVRRGGRAAARCRCPGLAGPAGPRGGPGGDGRCRPDGDFPVAHRKPGNC